VIRDDCFRVEPWAVREVRLDLGHLAQTESIFALSNGHIGWRANLDEGEPHVIAGSYLNAVYEDQYLIRYPVRENINFARLPYDLGILHYASDTPYTRGKNLGAGSLSYFGMDSTYASAVAILRRIFEDEIRLQQVTGPLQMEMEEQKAETKVS